MWIDFCVFFLATRNDPYKMPKVSAPHANALRLVAIALNNVFWRCHSRETCIWKNNIMRTRSTRRILHCRLVSISLLASQTLITSRDCRIDSLRSDQASRWRNSSDDAQSVCSLFLFWCKKFIQLFSLRNAFKTNIFMYKKNGIILSGRFESANIQVQWIDNKSLPILKKTRHFPCGNA